MYMTNKQTYIIAGVTIVTLCVALAYYDITSMFDKTDDKED